MSNFNDNNVNEPGISRKRKIVLNFSSAQKPDLSKFKNRFRALHQRRVITSYFLNNFLIILYLGRKSKIKS